MAYPSVWARSVAVACRQRACTFPPAWPSMCHALAHSGRTSVSQGERWTWPPSVAHWSNRPLHTGEERPAGKDIFPPEHAIFCDWKRAKVVPKCSASKKKDPVKPMATIDPSVPVDWLQSSSDEWWTFWPLPEQHLWGRQDDRSLVE